MNEITIAGRTVAVPAPYEEGHTLSSAEASVLNQTYAENVRNNLAKQFKDSAEGVNFQKIVDDYVAHYAFGVRSGGGGFRGDPVKTEAMSIAREAIKRALQKKGIPVTGDGDNVVSAKKITELAVQALEKHPEWMDLARSRVEEAKSIVEGLEV